MSGLLVQPMAAGPYGVREIGSKSGKRARRPSAVYWFFRPRLADCLPLPRSCVLLPTSLGGFFACRFSPFFGRSGGSVKSVGLLLCGQRPDPPRRPVGERHGDQLLRLACQHPGQPWIRDLAASARVLNNRHGSRDQEPPQVLLAHLRYPAQPRLAAGRVLPGHKAQPSREVAPAPEALHRRGEGLQRHRGDRPDSRDRHQARRLFVLPRTRPEFAVESVDLPVELVDPPEQQPAQLDDRLRQAAVPVFENSGQLPDPGPALAARPRRTRPGGPVAH